MNIKEIIWSIREEQRTDKILFGKSQKEIDMLLQKIESSLGLTKSSSLVDNVIEEGAVDSEEPATLSIDFEKGDLPEAPKPPKGIISKLKRKK